MIRTQKWEPDTHPSHELHTEWDWPDGDAPPVFVRCYLALVDGVEMPDPAALYASVLAENRMVSEVAEAIRSAMPDRMKKPVLDSDDEPTGEMVVKNKHQPQWRIGAGGAVLFHIPGADEDALALISAAVAPFGDAAGLE